LSQSLKERGKLLLLKEIERGDPRGSNLLGWLVDAPPTNTRTRNDLGRRVPKSLGLKISLFKSQDGWGRKNALLWGWGKMTKVGAHAVPRE